MLSYPWWGEGGGSKRFLVHFRSVKLILDSWTQKLLFLKQWTWRHNLWIFKQISLILTSWVASWTWLNIIFHNYVRHQSESQKIPEVFAVLDVEQSVSLLQFVCRQHGHQIFVLLCVFHVNKIPVQTFKRKQMCSSTDVQCYINFRYVEFCFANEGRADEGPGAAVWLQNIRQTSGAENFPHAWASRRT